jgi:hypothetical protein
LDSLRLNKNPIAEAISKTSPRLNEFSSKGGKEAGQNEFRQVMRVRNPNATHMMPATSNASEAMPIAKAVFNSLAPLYRLRSVIG